MCFVTIKIELYGLTICSGQNKCCKLYTMLKWYVNSDNSQINEILWNIYLLDTLLCLQIPFTGKLKKNWKKWNVFDFDNFEQCVKNGGDVIVMNCDDFFVSENWLCQSEESKLARPLLAYINIAEFCRGVTWLFYTTHDTANENPSFEEAYFLKRNDVRSTLQQ